ncbi:MAG: site-2 protease family protein [Elainellaceae cyanobacterium]
MLFWLILLGILTYVVVQRSVVDITRTPVWLLWTVMMVPAFIWTAWTMVNGEADIPVVLLLVPLISCPVVYWLLVQWGRPKQNYSSDQPSKSPSTLEDKGTPDGSITAQQASNVMMQLSTPSQPPSRPINKEDEEALKSCFPWAVYYLRNIEYRPQAVVCKGSLRTSPEEAYKTIWGNIQRLFEDRFLLVFQEGLDGKPFFTLVPNTLLAQRGKPLRARPGVALALLAATLLTTTLAGVLLSGVAADDLQASVSQLRLGLPYSLSLLSILAIHELSHYWAARRYRIKATLPYFIPVPPATIFPFGTFGAFIQTRSPLPHRKALFDIGISGPLAGLVVTIPILMWGLAHSSLVPLTEESSIFNFESFSPTSSLLIALLSRLALGSQLMTTSALALHPVAIAGCLGMVITALNLIPVGQLDGGHMVHAMFGQRAGVVIGQVARLLVLALAFVQNELLIWAILLFFMPIIDEPALNDVSQLDNKRDFLGLVTLALLVMILLPTPQVIARLLFTVPAL